MINFYKLSYFQKREYDIRALRRLVKDGLLLPLTERRQTTNAEAKEFFSKIKYKGA